jgi:hypothetical protein
MVEPSHKTLINRYLNWDLVRERLERYKTIGKLYSLDDLRACSSKPPFYCHYLGWRLGTWKNEGTFKFFDSLLANALNLPNWNKARISQGCEFQNFWALLWELQVAQLFTNFPVTIVEWNKVGPDLRVHSNSSAFFIECTTHPQSFGLEEFINELLGHVHPWIKADHILFNRFRLPNNAIEPYLDDLFKPLLNETFLQEMIKKAEGISPVKLHTPKSGENLFVFIENLDAENRDFDQPWNTTGIPENFLHDVVQDVLDKKRKSNKIKSNRPNILAVNLLLGDFQTGVALRKLPKPNLGKEFDAVFLTACGIDEIPSLKKGLLQFYNNHPIKEILTL